jgi:HSP20 family protein
MADQQGKERAGESMMRAGREQERGLASRPYQDPFSLMEWMFDRMQRDFFGPSVLGSLLAPEPVEGARGFVRLPRMQSRDTGDAIVVTAELPGLDPDDVHIELQQDTLTVRGETRREEKSEGGRFERHASFYRQVRLPEDIDADQVKASYDNGVLTIRFPRRGERQSVRQIPVTAASRDKAATESRDRPPKDAKADKDRAA